MRASFAIASTGVMMSAIGILPYQGKPSGT